MVTGRQSSWLRWLPRADSPWQRALVPAVLMMALCGCQNRTVREGSYLFWPSPPERPRVQFLTFANGAAELEPQRGDFEKFILGADTVSQRAINKPYGATAANGIVYVCDTKGLCVCKLDFTAQTFSVLGYSGPGRLRKPINIAMDSLGYKFVADPERKQVVVFGPDDQYVTAFDPPAPCRPVDVAVHGEELYVLDNDEDCQVVVLNRRTGQLIRSFGGPGGGPGQFKIPNSLCVDDEGYVYVSDTMNWRIHKLTPTGETVWMKGVPGRRLGQFGRPRGIRVGPDGVIYVVDGATEIVQMFNKEGQTLMRFGGPGSVPGALGLPSSLAVDASSLPLFRKYLHPDFDAAYLLFVVSQYGNHLVSVYAFGSFPDDYEFDTAEIAGLPEVADDAGIGPVGPDAVPPMEFDDPGSSPHGAPPAAVPAGVAGEPAEQE